MIESHKSDVNRRKHRRISVSEDVLKNSIHTPIDLSESGILLQTQKKIKDGSLLIIELLVENESYILKGEVMWSREGASIFDSGYRTGIRFNNIKTSDMLKLRAYIEKH